MNMLRQLALSALIAFAYSALGEPAFVSDQLVITVRALSRTDAEVLTHLRTGDSVEVLDTTSSEQFVRVRTEDGIEGWALRQYLVPEPSARERLTAAEAAARAARTRAEELSRQAVELETSLAEASDELNSESASVTALRAELEELKATSANAIALRDRNSELQMRAEESEAELQRISEQNRDLSDASKRDWFVVGAVVLGIGVLLGVILARSSRRRRWDW